MHARYPTRSGDSPPEGAKSDDRDIREMARGVAIRSVARMLRKNTLVALAGLTLLGACTKSVQDATPTPADLSDALLTVTDLGSQWQETQRQVFDQRSPENPSLDPSIFCADAEEAGAALVELAGQAGADVEMSYRGLTDGARMMRLQAWSNDDAEAYFDALAPLVETCDGVTETDDAGATEEFSEITGRSIGDESLSWSTRTIPPASTQDDKFESIGRTTVARFGKIIMVLQLGDANFTGSAVSLSEDDWWDIVVQAADKLDNLAGD